MLPCLFKVNFDSWKEGRMVCFKSKNPYFNATALAMNLNKMLLLYLKSS